MEVTQRLGFSGQKMWFSSVCDSMGTSSVSPSTVKCGYLSVPRALTIGLTGLRRDWQAPPGPFFTWQWHTCLPHPQVSAHTSCGHSDHAGLSDGLSLTLLPTPGRRFPLAPVTVKDTLVVHYASRLPSWLEQKLQRHLDRSGEREGIREP